MNQVKHLSCKPQQGIKKVQNYLFRFSDFLGKGNFSSVYKGINQITNQTVAIKYIALSSLNCQRLLELLDQQIQIFTSVNHPNIVKCYEVLKSSNNCYIITQLCNDGDLQSLLKKKGIFEQQQAIPFIRDIFEGLYYLSKKNIVHRDIKVANIFLHNKKAKIADFGFAQRSKIQFIDGKIGTPLCMSPEGFLQNLYGCKTDVWAFGIILYQLTHGKIYLDNCNTEQMLRQNIQKQLKIQQLRHQLSYQFKQLIIKCLDVNPCTRITFEQIRKHSFIQKIMKNRIQPFSVQNLNCFQSFSINTKSMNKLQDIIKPQNNKQNKNNNIEYSQLNFHKNNQIFNKNIHQKQNISHFGNVRICQTKLIKKQDNQIFQYKPLQFDRQKPFNLRIKNLNTVKNLTPIDQQKQISSKHNIPQFLKGQKLNYCPSQRRLTGGKIPIIFTVQKNKSKMKTQHDQNTYTQHDDNHQIIGPDEKIFNRGKLHIQRKNSNNTPKTSFLKAKKILMGFIKFNQAIGLIHYCRLLYKYIIELKITKIYQEGNLNLKYYSNFLLNLLNELQEKLTNGHIVVAKSSEQLETKQNKLLKMQKVVQQYIQRYKPNLQKQRDPILNKNPQQIQKIIMNDQILVDSFYIPDKKKIEYYHKKILIFTEVLDKSSKFQKYNIFDSNPQLQQTTKDSNTQRSSKSHKQLDQDHQTKSIY